MSTVGDATDADVAQVRTHGAWHAQVVRVRRMGVHCLCKPCRALSQTRSHILALYQERFVPARRFAVRARIEVALLPKLAEERPTVTFAAEDPGRHECDSTVASWSVLALSPTVCETRSLDADVRRDVPMGPGAGVALVVSVRCKL